MVLYMYASSFLKTIIHVETTAQSTINDVHHLGHSKTADRNLISIIKALSDYRTLVDRMEITPPAEKPPGADIIGWYINQKQDREEIHLTEVPEQYRSTEVEENLLEVVGNRVLIPLAEVGPMAYSWFPLLETILTKLQNITRYLDDLRSRASVDCAEFLENVWSSLYYFAKTTYRLTKIQYISHKTVFDHRGDLHDIRRNTNKMG